MLTHHPVPGCREVHAKGGVLDNEGVIRKDNGGAVDIPPPPAADGPSSSARGRDQDRSPDRDRDRYRSDRRRSRSRSRSRDRDRYRSDRRRSRSRSRERGRGRGDTDRMPPPSAAMPDKPEQYGCYRGRVSNVMEYGCFIELLGFRSKQEGLCHVSNMASRKVGSARELVNRNDTVWVKVLSMTGRSPAFLGLVPLATSGD